MGLLTFSSFFTLISLIIPLRVHSFCPISSCPNESATPIRFPFYLYPQQQQNCSYPGFTLHCTDNGFTALTLPQAGQFLVRNINYQEQNIQLYDPKNCFPEKLLKGFDPSGSPFQADSFTKYTFLSCPKNFTDERFIIIECLSNSTRSVVATSLTILAHTMSNKSCFVIKTVPVPVSSSPNVGRFTARLADDVSLSWNVPDCKDCEVKRGFCQLIMNGSQQIGCVYDPPGSENSSGQNSRNLLIFRIIAFCIAIPAILSAIGVGIFLCIMDRREGEANWLNRRGHQIAATPEPPDVAVGLDQATIDSYTKAVLGESCRVPGLNDGSCPICLSDFKPTETLRCIPDCQHCFHADCIDEWLRLNGTCPLCRSSPAHQLASENAHQLASENESQGR